MISYRFVIFCSVFVIIQGDVDLENKKLQVALNSTNNIVPSRNVGREGVPVFNEGGGAVVAKPETPTDKKTSTVDPINEFHDRKSSIHARKEAVLPVNDAVDVPVDKLNKTTVIPKPDVIVPPVNKTAATNSKQEVHKPLVTNAVDDASITIPELPPLILDRPLALETKSAPKFTPIGNEVPKPVAEPEWQSTFKKFIDPLSKVHPNYIIPIVITIFAVPVFGIIGLTAIRRGREVWKNRHYRRMDFLIDGMYND